jgi:hypothetical protein
MSDRLRRLFWDFVAWTVSLFAKPLWRSVARVFRPVVVGPGESPEDIDRQRRVDRQNGAGMLVVAIGLAAFAAWRWVR